MKKQTHPNRGWPEVEDIKGNVIFGWTVASKTEKYAETKWNLILHIIKQQIYSYQLWLCHKMQQFRCHESGCHSLHLLHHTTTAHHPWTTTPIIHCTTTHTFPSTNHTAVTNHSLALIVSPHLHLIHSPTYKQHTSLHTLRSLVLAPADISERLPFPLIATSAFDPGLPYLGTLNLCLWPRPLPGIVYVSALPLIFLLLPADHCLFDSV